jgi:uncharacterized protein YhjY with autotransporter beta-barrel domain
LAAGNLRKIATSTQGEGWINMSAISLTIDSRRTAWTSLAARAVIGGAACVVGFLGIPAEGTAQTFNSAASGALNAACAADIETPFSPLSFLCDGIATGGGTTSGPGAISTPTAAAFIEQRRRTGSGGEGSEPKTGASADTAKYSLGGGVNAFATAGGEVLNHRNNKFEDGYSSAVPTVTIGADYRITEWMIAGLAVNYTYQDGTYDNGGRFDTHSYGPLLFASFTPLPGVFTDVAPGYNHQDYFRKRPAQAFDAAGEQVASGHARGNYNGDQYSAGLSAGYDHPLEGFTIGPRAGLNYVYTDVENYSESSATGLQLRYRGLNQSSLQTTLGAVATMPISTSFGVVQPQFGVSWVHEFLNDARNIQAEYLSVTDPSATQFTFKREQPARDWAVIDLGVAVVLPNQLQPFVNLTTIQGNENFSSYGGVIGARMGF